MTKKRIAVIFLLLAAGTAGFFKASKLLKLTAINTYEDSGLYVQNPYQGMYIQADTGDRDMIKGIPGQGCNLVLLAYDLSGFQSDRLPKTKLKELESAFELCSDLGLQVIFRAAYGFGGESGEPDDFELLKLHMEQISNILNSYEKQLVCIQAGMLGPWGEGNSSRYFEDEDSAMGIRNDVAIGWHRLLAPDIQLQLRTPANIQSASDSGIPLSRLGMHNDALLGSDTDLGTYTDRHRELDWIERNLGHSRTGGETAAVSEFSSGDNAVGEFDALGLSYLNLLYNLDVMDQWKYEMHGSISAYDYIQNHLGLRVHAARSVVPRHMALYGQSFKVSLKNTGFASDIQRLNFMFVISTEDSIEFFVPDSIDRGMDEFLVSTRLGNLPDDKKIEVGLWAGYGTPGDGTQFILSNDSELLTDYGFKIASYKKTGFWYSLTD